MTAPELAARLGRRGVDRAAYGRELVREAAGELVDWLRTRPATWSFDDAGTELEAGWSAWDAAHGWRGICARFLDSLREVHHWARGRAVRGPADAALGPREALLEELGLWLASTANDLAEPAWIGEPLGDGARFANERDVVPAALRELERGSQVLVWGEGPLAARVLGEAHRAGLAPTALVAEGGGDFAGRRLARELVDAGVRTRLAFDVVALQALDEADLLLLTSEAVGAGAALVRAGGALACAEARRREVPARVLATRDAVVPGGAIELPARDREDDWMLWPDAPAGVELDARCRELLPLDAADVFWTDAGIERPAELCVRGMKPFAAPPCDANHP